MSERPQSVALDRPPGPQPAQATALAAGRSLPLDHAGRLVCVRTGRVELYAVCRGRRFFLAEFQAGAVLFGGGTEALIAVADEDTTLVEIDAVDDIAGSVDHWVSSLSAGLAAHRNERPTLRGIAAGERLAPAKDAPVAVSAMRGVLWIATTEHARIRFMDVVENLLGRPVPVTPATWLAIEDGEVTGEATATLLGRSGWITALVEFHGAIAAVLQRWDELAQADETARIDRREAHTDTRLADAEQRFKAILAGSASHPLDRAGPSTPGGAAHAVLEAVLGAALGPVQPRRTADGQDFAAYATSCGFHTREVRLEGTWWRGDKGRLAARLTVDGRHVALVPDWLGRYRLLIPGEPARRVTAAVAAGVDPVALQVLKPLPNRALRARDVVAIGLAMCRFDVGTLALASFAAALLGLAMPIAIGEVVNVFIPNQLRDGIVQVGLGLGVLALATTLLDAAADMARLRMDGRLSAAIQTGVVDRVLRMPSRLLRTQSSADLAQRLMSVEHMRRTVTHTVLDTLLSGLFGLSGLGLLFVYSPPSALVAIGLFVVLAAGAALAARGQLRQLTIGELMTATAAVLTLQLIQKVSTLRAFGAERRAFIVWARNAASMRSRMLRSRLVYVLFDACVATYGLLALAAVFVVLGYAGGAALPTGTYLAFIVTYQGFLAASVALSRSIVQVAALKPMIDRAELVLGTVPETPPHAKQPGVLSGMIEVSNLSFAFGPGLPMVLRQVSLQVLPGQSVALVGPSGSGKSTLTSLILGFDQPTGGVVLFDGQDLALLDKSAVRRQIGIVRQGGRVFAGSLFDNIRGMHGGSLDDAWAAAKVAGIAADIRAMPMDMHTTLNEGTSTLSGGQVQRLLLARALMGKPRLLILDEATSALDNVTQAMVTDNIERLGVTRIVVAHRLSTIRKADVIHFLVDGRIEESGSYDELMRAGARFADFVRRQAL